MPLEERAVEALLEDIEPALAALQFDQGVCAPGRGNAGGEEHAAADDLGQISRVLDGVVQVHFVDAVIPLAGGELVEVQDDPHVD